MSDNNTIGLGATVEVNDGSGSGGSAFGLILDVISINTPDVDVGNVVSKRLNLPARTLTKLPTLVDPGDFSFQYEYSAGKKTRLDALIGVNKQFRVTVPSTGATGETTYVGTVPGFIKANKMDAVNADGIVTVTCTVTITGPAL